MFKTIIDAENYVHLHEHGLEGPGGLEERIGHRAASYLINAWHEEGLCKISDRDGWLHVRTYVKYAKEAKALL